MFDRTPNRNLKNRTKCRKLKAKLGYHALEERQLLAVSVALDSGGVVQIMGDTLDNRVEVSTLNATTVRVLVDNSTHHDFAASAISSFRFIGGNGNDTYINTTNFDSFATGNRGNDILQTAGGNDRLYGGFDRDTISSTGGNNILNGLEDVDIITGGSGNDIIYGFEGDDIIEGNGGDDFIVSGAGDDIVNGGDGNDTIFGSFGNDVIHGNAGNDNLYSQEGDDLVYGDEGNDTVRGGAGIDRLWGHAGDDLVIGDEDNDEMYGGSGTDRMFGADGVDEIFGGDDRDFIYAGNGNDFVYGEGGDDHIRGNAGNDHLFGGDGRDRLGADDGDDHLDGQAGADIILGNDGNDEIVGTTADYVIPGAGNDKINLGTQLFDRVVFSGAASNYSVTQTGNLFVVTDSRGIDGVDEITGVEFFQFSDRTDTPAPTNVIQRLMVQPIIVSDDDGTNTAEFFGNAEQELEIKQRVDAIFLQANVDVEWLPVTTYNNTFANIGNNGSAIRNSSDLDTIAQAGDSAGVGSSDALVIDMYFVEHVPGFEPQSNNVANGLAFLGFNGVTMHVGDNLVGFDEGRAVVAQVAAHELAHNLGLDHVHVPENLMDDGIRISSSQRNTILSSTYTTNI